MIINYLYFTYSTSNFLLAKKAYEVILWKSIFLTSFYFSLSCHYYQQRVKNPNYLCLNQVFWQELLWDLQLLHVGTPESHKIHLAGKGRESEFQAFN